MSLSTDCAVFFLTLFKRKGGGTSLTQRTCQPPKENGKLILLLQSCCLPGRNVNKLGLLLNQRPFPTFCHSVASAISRRLGAGFDDQNGLRHIMCVGREILLCACIHMIPWTSKEKEFLDASPIS